MVRIPPSTPGRRVNARAGAAAVATPRCGRRRIPRPPPDHRLGPARHPARRHSAEDRPRPRRNRAQNADPPDLPRRAPAARQSGDAAPRPVITRHLKWGLSAAKAATVRERRGWTARLGIACGGLVRWPGPGRPTRRLHFSTAPTPSLEFFPEARRRLPRRRLAFVSGRSILES